MKSNKMYAYIEYSAMDVTEKMIKVSTDIDKLKNFLREKVENYFKCPWDEIEDKIFSGDDTLSDVYVHYDDTCKYLTWEIEEIEVL